MYTLQGRQITTGDLEEMGGCFCQALSHLQRCLAVYQEAVGRQEREDDKSQHDTQSADRERYMYVYIHTLCKHYTQHGFDLKVGLEHMTLCVQVH